MSRSSRRAEAARNQVNSAAEDIVRTAADRVGPLAQSAAERVGPLAEAAADVLGAAADKVSPLAHSAATRVGPLAHSAADRVGPLAHAAGDRIAPLAGQAVDRLSPYAKDAAGRVAPLAQGAAGYAQIAADRLSPIAATARQRTSQVTSEAVRRFGPVLDDAVERVTPAMEMAKGKVTGDLLPKLSLALSAAAANPLVEEAGQRAEAALAAAKGELKLPEKKPKLRWVKRIAIVGALGAVVVVVVRRFVSSKDADWQAARPSTPYVPPPSGPTSATTVPSSTDTLDAAGIGATGVGTAVADEPPAGDSVEVETAEESALSSADQPPVDSEIVEPVLAEEDFAAAEPEPVTMGDVGDGGDGGDIEETVVDEVVVSEPVDDLPETEPLADLPEAEPVGKAAKWSGEGVYVGSEPPEGYVIKGNERSMKYHMPQAAGYGRTIAEVWFNSEEAAQHAGFVRAQR